MPEPHTILCVDDETVGLRIRKVLLERSGYRVLVAESGPLALQAAGEDHIDLAVIDFLMSGMKGDELAARLRQTQPSLPIIMLSAYVLLPEHALDNCNLLLVKGESPQRLLDAIQELLDHSGAHPGAAGA